MCNKKAVTSVILPPLFKVECKLHRKALTTFTHLVVLWTIVYIVQSKLGNVCVCNFWSSHIVWYTCQLHMCIKDIPFVSLIDMSGFLFKHIISLKKSLTNKTQSSDLFLWGKYWNSWPECGRATLFNICRILLLSPLKLI